MDLLIDRNQLQNSMELDLLSRPGRMRTDHIPSYVESYSIRRQLADLNRKANDFGVTLPLKQEAFAKFQNIQLEMEALSIVDDEVLLTARDLIHSWLPPLERVWDQVWERCAYGPGTIFHARRPHERSLLWKIGGKQTVTPKAYYLSVEVIGKYYPRFASLIRNVDIVRGNRVAHVSKDVGKCRQIAVEPSLNVFLQKGIGSFLENLLKRLGLSDLSTGQQLHRRLVRDWKRWGTIDLSDASDRIATSLVRYLLPTDWFELLDSTRSHYFLHEQSWAKYSSFTSQGNAFTFPLETMIFTAIARAVCSGERVSVYGDDIVVPVESAPLVAQALERAGFKVNAEKSFWGQHTGIEKFFRESCGEDTLFGYGVRPVFYRDGARSFTDIAALANRLYERWGYLPVTHDYLVSLIPPDKRLIGPRYEIRSDGGLQNHVSSDYSAYLWEEVALEPVKWIRCAYLQCQIAKIRYWSNKSTSLSSQYRLNSEAELLAFLYSGSPDTSPISRPKTRLKVVSRCLLVDSMEQLINC